MYFFLKDDLLDIDKKVVELVDRLKKVGEMVGESCREGAETYHDNFGYEEGVRQMHMLSSEIKRLASIKKNAQVVDGNVKKDKVKIGCSVEYLDQDTKEIKKVFIGSYMILSPKPADYLPISYMTPLAKILLNGKVGDIRQGLINFNLKSLKIISIT